MKPTLVREIGAGAEGENRVESPNAFLSTLNKYKELIAVMIFFIGGVSWIYGYFATKEQVRFVKCLMNTNIELIQYQLQQKLILDEKRQYDLEYLRLLQVEKRSIDDQLIM